MKKLRLRSAVLKESQDGAEMEEQRQVWIPTAIHNNKRAGPIKNSEGKTATSLRVLLRRHRRAIAVLWPRQTLVIWLKSKNKNL